MDAINLVPADLVLDVRTQIAETNIEPFEVQARKFLDTINTQLNDDDDFENAARDCKLLKEVEKKIRDTIQKVTSGNQNVEEIVSLASDLAEEFKRKRVALEHLITTEKNNRKAAIFDAALDEIRSDFLQHDHLLPMLKISMPLDKLKQRVEEAGKNKKGIAGIQKAVNAVVTSVRMELQAEVLRLESRLRLIPGDRSYLFHDRITLIASHSDLEAIVYNRVVADDRRKEEEEAQAVKALLAQQAAKRVVAEQQEEPFAVESEASALPSQPAIHVHSLNPDRRAQTTASQAAVRPSAHEQAGAYRVLLRCTRSEAIAIGQHLKRDYPDLFVSVVKGE